MHCITIAMRDTNAPVWTLMFKTEETCEAAWAVLTSEAKSVGVLDDFGQIIQVERSCIAALLREDLDQSLMAYAARALHNTRAQAKAQTMAMSDPALKVAAISRGSPAIHSPFGNGSGMGHG